MLKNNLEKYEPGQIWTYKNSLDGLYLMILKVEHIDNEKIIHIAIIGSEDSPDHMPFNEDSINISVDKLISDNATVPDFEEGYNYWKEHFLMGDAGIYSISVADALAF